ncbi:MAG: hypothetical protein H0V17_27120, partial [Deltaproteobacteria bacterium]|nr:hypothetical protein [Deltaproteobacteria bacterium]
MGLTFDGLAEVTVARDLLRRWWGLDLGLSEPDGGGYVRTSHATCESVRGVAGPACDAALREIAAGFAKTKRTLIERTAAVVQRCHAGLTIVAAPGYGDAGLAGVV